MFVFRKDHLVSYLVVVIILVNSLIGCTGKRTDLILNLTAPTETEKPSLAPSLTASPTLTLTRPPSTATFTSTPLLPTPSFPVWSDNTLMIGQLLFEDTVPECQLPCWQGLNIGKSGPQEIQNLFDTVFGFNGTLDFFADNPIAAFTGLETSGVSGIYDTGYIWEVGDGGIRVITAFDEQTMKLEGLILKWTVSEKERFEVDLTPERTIRELGTPTYTLAAFNGLGTDALVQLSYLMIYDKGLAFDFYTWAWVETTPEVGTVRYCLDDPEIPSGPYLGRIVITEPLVDGLNNLSPLQVATFGREIDTESLLPVEDVFGVTGAEITQLVSQGNTCLSATVK